MITFGALEKVFLAKECKKCPGRFLGIIIQGPIVGVQPVTCCDLLVFYSNLRYIL